MKTVSTGLVVFAGLLAGPVAPTADRTPSPVPMPKSEDPRLVRLQQFLGEKECPAHRYAADFIQAADNNDLDWRLLPSISIIESGGGKEARNNNIFGWASAQKRFSSVRASIHLIAERLANSPLYRDKTVDQILRTYNPEREDYVAQVKGVMRQIARSEMLYNAVN